LGAGIIAHVKLTAAHLVITLQLAAVMAAGCSDEQHDVLVELRTDLVPGVEFVAVRTSMDEPVRLDDRSAVFGDDYLTGQRVAELIGVPAGDRRISVRLIDAGGALVAERRVRLTFSEDLGVTVLVTRDCEGLACGVGQTCVGGRCTSEQCLEGVADEQCAAPECTADADCISMSACAIPTCSEGLCLYAAGACGPSEYCDVAAGCRPLPDGPPRECGTLPPTCGALADESCCTSVGVPGGTFLRGNDAAPDQYTATTLPATVSSFSLDRYEVTVGRFRQFLEAGLGTGANPPAAGAGAHPAIVGSGWDPTWNADLPADTDALRAALACGSSYPNWTDTPAGNESQPINCVTWWEAMAFCIWDGGYLPTDAEWHYAALGGDEQRAYPWSVPSSSTTIDCTLANTSSCVPGPSPVGSLSPAGDGRWGHADLGGNMWELTLDWFNAYTTPCVDCANLDDPAAPSDPERVLTSGGYDNGEGSARSAGRLEWSPARRHNHVGFRCARPE